MAVLTAQAPNITGAALTPVAVSSSDTILPGNNVYVMVITVGTGATVGIVVPGSLYGQARPDVATAVGTNTWRIFGPLVSDLADVSTGLVTITYSATTAITCVPMIMGA